MIPRVQLSLMKRLQEIYWARPRKMPLGNNSIARGNQVKTVIGVIKDFNFEALNRAVRAQLFIMPGDFAPSKIFVRFQAGDPADAIALLESAWKKFVPDFPLNIVFLMRISTGFINQKKNGAALWDGPGVFLFFLPVWVYLDWLLCCCEPNQRNWHPKSARSIRADHCTFVIKRFFALLVIIAMLIASPIAWYFMNKWLLDYAYRINISWWVFAITGIVTVFIAFITISFQAVKVAWPTR